MKRIICSCAIIAALTSCGGGSKEQNALKMENDSLRLEYAKLNSQIEEQLALINDVQDGFDQIKQAENYLVTASNTTGEVSSSSRDRIATDMRLISEILTKNKEQIATLKEQLKKGGLKSTQLQRSIERLSMDLDEKTALITQLQEELAKRNVTIAELDQAVAQLSGHVESLSAENTSKDKVINVQDKELNKAFYCFGTSRELKDQKIIQKGKVLDNGFNEKYFIEVDVRKMTEIPLFAKKAKLLTNHPATSYELTKDEEGKLTLRIKDINSFWSIGRYLVIQVD